MATSNYAPMAAMSSMRNKSVIVNNGGELEKLSHQIQSTLSSILGGTTRSYENWQTNIGELTRDVDEKVRDVAHRIRIAEVQRKRRHLEKKRHANRTQYTRFRGEYTEHRLAQSSPKFNYGTAPEMQSAFRAVIKEFQSHRRSQRSHRLSDCGSRFGEETRHFYSRDDPTTLFDLSDNTIGLDMTYTDNPTELLSEVYEEPIDIRRSGSTVLIPSNSLKSISSQYHVEITQNEEIAEENSKRSTNLTTSVEINASHQSDTPQSETPDPIENHMQQSTPCVAHRAPYPDSQCSPDEDDDGSIKSETTEVQPAAAAFQDTHDSAVCDKKCDDGQDAPDAPPTWTNAIHQAAAKCYDAIGFMGMNNVSTDAASSADMKDSRLESDIYESEPFKSGPTLKSSFSVPRMPIPPLMPDNKYQSAFGIEPMSANATPRPPPSNFWPIPAAGDVNLPPRSTLIRAPGTCSQSDLQRLTEQTITPNTYFPIQPQGLWQPPLRYASPPQDIPFGGMPIPQCTLQHRPQWSPQSYVFMNPPEVELGVSKMGYYPPQQLETPDYRLNRRQYSRATEDAFNNMSQRKRVPPSRSAHSRGVSIDHVPLRKHARRGSWTQQMFEDLVALPQIFRSCSQFDV